MGNIFKDKKAKAGAVMASPPEEDESAEEIKQIENLTGDDVVAKEVSPEPASSEINYKQIPVCMSQEQINNLVIENNIMLKEIITEIQSD